MLGDEENVSLVLSFYLHVEFQQSNVFVEDIKIQKTFLEERG